MLRSWGQEGASQCPLMGVLRPGHAKRVLWEALPALWLAAYQHSVMPLRGQHVTALPDLAPVPGREADSVTVTRVLHLSDTKGPVWLSSLTSQPRTA